MSDLDLSFPDARDPHFPSPVLTLNEYHAWVTSHWMALSDEERARALRESWLEHTGERFCLDADAA
jgi:hypothetical protein